MDCPFSKMGERPENDPPLTPPLSEVDTGINNIANEAVYVLRLESLAIAHVADNLSSNSGSFVRAVLAIFQAHRARGKVIFTGMGKSGKIAQKIVATFLSLGIETTFLHPTEALHGDLGTVREGDIVIALSNSGSTSEINNIIPLISSRNVQVISVCSEPSSTLVRISNIVIDSSIPPPLQEIAAFGVNSPTTSTTVQLAIGDALALTLSGLIHLDVSKTFSENHPGGLIGRRLMDDMIKFADLPRISIFGSLLEAMEASFMHSSRCVLVHENDVILGIVSPERIRQNFRKEVKAGEIMIRFECLPCHDERCLVSDFDGRGMVLLHRSGERVGIWGN
ncbi:Arabinose 5-phosphate isomerase KdsD [Neolecta irregularis DAH-3]|uniref:Arabinose 5-phosphate isomerase KdsD n=1 Tax=Neolecta irregularis (strain DAH-3) TaxID=1198029 RepID=A0A1U7LIX2_NEOID|nr:Arabinose 5-phosphate isomerase KdsD [Neolecta irregularis DAH-3]|eukprot:OLL22543.1 Arabinose 5-phosphate isomerase KdsD [Neolecta irregularis DAH-3]